MEGYDVSLQDVLDVKLGPAHDEEHEHHIRCQGVCSDSIDGGDRGKVLPPKGVLLDGSHRYIRSGHVGRNMVWI